jgi:dephospho-CoA kinase
MSFSDREARLIDDREKIAKADYHYVNTGTYEDMDAFVAGVMAELTNNGS